MSGKPPSAVTHTAATPAGEKGGSQAVCNRLNDKGSEQLDS